jgi:hypothetical protein
MKTSGMRKAPGVRAKKTGTRLKRGMATQVMTYPRLVAKKALVEASRDAGLALSSFMVLASLKEAAALQGCEIGALVPAEELQRYQTFRAYRKRSAPAKRANARMRAQRA